MEDDKKNRIPHPAEMPIESAKQYCLERNNLVMIERHDGKRDYCIYHENEWWSAELYTQKLVSVFCKDEDIFFVRGLTGFDY